MLNASDRDEDLVHVSCVPRTRPLKAHCMSKAGAKFLTPTPQRLIGDGGATFGERHSTSWGLRLNTLLSQGG